MSEWKEIVAAAIVGTGRLRPPTPAGLLAPLLGGREYASPEEQLLLQAGAVSLYSRAGRRPLQLVAPSAPPAEAETWRVCSAAACGHLRSILLGEDAAALGEWLAAAVGAARLVPPEMLPELLTAAVKQPVLREAALRAGGRRALWLAGRNPAWTLLAAAAAAEPDPSVWEHGSRSERRDLLRAIRAADPQRGRELLEAVWATEPPDGRECLLPALSVNLSPADEPFLDQARGDRIKAVRMAAIDLLARLPESALVLRARTRLGPLIRVVPGSRLLGIRRPPQVSITLPKLDDPAEVRAMEADGVYGTSRPPAMGEGAWRLSQLLGMVPPSQWSEAAGAEPAVLLDAALRGEWEMPLLLGWAQAAERFADAEWAEALAGDQRLPPELRDRLASVVPPERLQVVAAAVLQQEASVESLRAAVRLLDRVPAPWDAALSRRMLEIAKKVMRHVVARYAVGEDLLVLAYRIHPELAGDAANGWPEITDSPTTRDRVERLIRVMEFRREMLREMKT